MTETPSKWAMEKAFRVQDEYLSFTGDDAIDEWVQAGIARALYDAATAHAKPADTPQADIVGGESSEGGSGETKTFARGEPLTWNVMGDGR